MLGRQFNHLLLLTYLGQALALPSSGIHVSRATAVNPVGNSVNFGPNDNGDAYPRANYLSSGDLIGSFTAFPPDGQQVITVVTSTDDGASWKLTGTVARKPVKSGSLDNAFPLQIPSGRIVIAFRNHDIDANGAPTVYRITLCSSDDNGASWKFLSDAVVITAQAVNNGVWEPFLRNAPDGGLQLYYSHERSNLDQDSVMFISYDGGMTWGKEQSISGVTEAASRDGMVGIAELSSSALVAVFETNENGGPFSLATVSSSDGGMTWGNRKSLYTSAPERNAGAPQIIKIGNTLVVSFMTNEDYDASVPNFKWIEKADAKVITSTDNGATWSKPTTVFKAPAFWPGLVALKDNQRFLYLAGALGLESQTLTAP